MVVDCFQLLELPRRPWLDEKEVRAQFQRLAGAAHPDGQQGNNAQFVALNQAWQTLRSPTTRLRHYLELTDPEALQNTASSPAVSADLFMEIAEAQQRANAIAARWAEAKSPLARAILEPERMATRKQLEALASKVAEESNRLHRQLQADAHLPAQLAAALSQLIFLEKWSGQLRERLVALG
jgi:hypothetical protein